MKSKKQRRIENAQKRLLEQNVQTIAYNNNSEKTANLPPQNDEPLQHEQLQESQEPLEDLGEAEQLGELVKKLQNIEEIKNKIVEPISFDGVEKPKFKRVVSYTNCVSTYLGQNRKVSIAQEDDDTFIIETKRTLNEGEEFKDYNPAILNHKTKWGISVVSCKINISREAMIAIGMAFNEMLEDGKIK